MSSTQVAVRSGRAKRESGKGKPEYVGVTFQPNKAQGIHRWYPYIEGFSGEFVTDILDEFGVGSGLVFDPFGGCGTTALEASLNGLDSVSTDVNPFMCFVARAKTRKYCRGSLRQVESRLRRQVSSYSPNGNTIGSLSSVFSDMGYFDDHAIRKIGFLKQGISRITNSGTRDFFSLALASILVAASRLKRAPDLKFKSENSESVEVFEAFLAAVDRMQIDMEKVEDTTYGEATVLCDNITSPALLGTHYDKAFDIAITSPPYLNGTNYFRNTKLELWVFDYLESQKDLRTFRETAITAGINAVQMKKRTTSQFPAVRDVVDKMIKTAYDPRIPVMVSAYFEDMHLALKNIHRVLKRGCYCVLVIGDSYFGDTHIPTDVLLGQIAERIGLSLEENRIVRSRKSRGGFPLHESVLVLRKTKHG